MPTVKEVRQWLGVVAAAQLATQRALVDEVADSVNQEYELRRALEYLEAAFAMGLEAHGQAVLREYLESHKAPDAAA